MYSCPKCKSYDIDGPTYRRANYGSECLLYVCRRCGYQHKSECADAFDATASAYEVEAMKQLSKDAVR